MGGRGVWVGVTGAYWCLLLVTSGGIRPEREPKSDAGADFGSGNGSKKKRWEKRGYETKRNEEGRWSREYSPGNVAGVSASLPGRPQGSHRYPEIPLLPHTETDSERTDMTMIIYI